MTKLLLRSIADTVAPQFIRAMRKTRWLRREAALLRNRLDIEGLLADQVHLACNSELFRSNQKEPEITALLKLLKELQPERLCEIGACRGGTLALFASVAASNANILSIDLHYPECGPKVYRRLARPGQGVTCMEGDSHSPNTLQRVERWLNGCSLDFLFIDGDHSYAGVQRDFEMYAPLVRRGGVIAFHDIVADFRTRFGIESPSDVGEVPRFWHELKQPFNGGTVEFIENPEQDGYGIGVIRVVEEQT